jgi:hypothetical protein
LQKEEVSGIIKTKFDEFHALWKNDKDEINVEGFVIDELGNKVFFNENVGKERFVPHEKSYYDEILSLICSHLQKKSK